MKSTITLASGVTFDIAHPWVYPLPIRDVSHSLSNICRFTGHCRWFYSVAQHSVLVSYLVPKEHALEGLVHDAVEAIVGDMSSPLKKLVPEYKQIEHMVEQSIAFSLGVSFPLPPCVKEADTLLLEKEQEYLMAPKASIWKLFTKGAIIPWPRWYARYRFLKRYRELTAA